jgi:hypothetical protein
MQRLAVVALLAGCSLGTASAEQLLMLRDGRTVTGNLVSGNSQYLVFRDQGGAERRFNLSEIQSLDFNFRGSAVTTGATNRMRANREERGADVRTLPDGTRIAVRTNEAIDSDIATEGQTFPAIIDQDVTDSSGAIAIPRGSDARLVIRRTSGGGVTGSPTLALDLESVSANGRNYLVSTEDVTQSGRSGIGVNKRTGEMVGGGAALGTLLGAIAGGGKGAAIGAIAGAAAGGTAQVLTKGKTVKVPAETELTFRLDRPLRLTAR